MISLDAVMLQQAIISWISSSKGGRARPPAGPVFATIARFENDRTWPQQAWSLRLQLREALLDGNAWLAEVRWVAETAPHQVVEAGARFELYEGPKMVATGLVLSANAPVPSQDDVRELVLV